MLVDYIIMGMTLGMSFYSNINCNGTVTVYKKIHNLGGKTKQNIKPNTYQQTL